MLLADFLGELGELDQGNRPNLRLLVFEELLEGLDDVFFDDVLLEVREYGGEALDEGVSDPPAFLGGVDEAYLFEELVSDFLFFKGPRDGDCALEGLYLYDVERIGNQGVPDVVEVTSYYLLVHSLREALHILCHRPPNQRPPLLQG